MTMPAISESHSKSGRLPTLWGIGVIVALGLGLRCIQAFEDRALWLDEAMLALNIRRLSFSELCGPLQYDQAAPIGFLWGQKLATFVVPDQEISARIVPWISGCLALLIFANLMIRIANAKEWLAVTAMAFSPTLICYSGEGKQYSLDVLCCVLALWMGVRWIKSPTCHAAQWAAIFGAVVPWVSHTGVFYLPGVVVLAVVFRKQTGWPVTCGCAAGVAASVSMLYLLHICEVGGNASLNNFWRADYVPWKAIQGGLTECDAVAAWTLRRWWELTVRSPGLAPGVNPAAAAWFAVAGVTVTMTWVLFCVVTDADRSRWLIVTYTILPVIACFAAAAFEIYPFGNRLLLFSAPLVFFLLGHLPLTSVWNGMRRYHLDVLLSAVVLTWPVVSACDAFGELKSVENMFAPHYEEDIRPFVAQMIEPIRNEKGCYVFHAARPAFEFYSGDHNDNVFFGSPGDAEHYRAEVQTCLGEHPGACFLFAHTAPWDTLEPLLAYEFLVAQECQQFAPSHDDVRFFVIKDQQTSSHSGSLYLGPASTSHAGSDTVGTDEHTQAGM